MPTTTNTSRYPLQVEIDGDFHLPDIAAACGSAMPCAARPYPGLARAARQAQLWRLDHIDDAARNAVLTAAAGRPDIELHRPLADDLAVLRAFEASPLFKPPVAAATGTLTPSLAAAWLALAHHWIGRTTHSGDLRFLNAACKLLGAVWIHYDAARRRSVRSLGPWHELTGRLTTVAHLIGAASDDLAARLRDRLLVPAVPVLAPRLPLGLGTTAIPAGHAAASVTVLAGAGSAGAQRFLHSARIAGIPVTAVCWYGQTNGETQTVHSGYADAWYPPADGDHAPALVPASPHPCQIAAQTWTEVAAALRDQPTDLIVLLGMPIVPEPILRLARLGVINAHNGALPTYRGMDAVGWAVLNNDPIVCTLHLAVPAVDQGPVLAAEPVPLTPTGGLRDRVKATQLRLLLAAARFVAATGRLPASTAQPDGGRQYYRLHPHLKRLLDGWSTSHTEPLDPTEKG